MNYFLFMALDCILWILNQEKLKCSHNNCHNHSDINRHLTTIAKDFLFELLSVYRYLVTMMFVISHHSVGELFHVLSVVYSISHNYDDEDHHQQQHNHDDNSDDTINLNTHHYNKVNLYNNDNVNIDENDDDDDDDIDNKVHNFYHDDDNNRNNPNGENDENKHQNFKNKKIRNTSSNKNSSSRSSYHIISEIQNLVNSLSWGTIFKKKITALSHTNSHNIKSNTEESTTINNGSIIYNYYNDILYCSGYNNNDVNFSFYIDDDEDDDDNQNRRRLDDKAKYDFIFQKLSTTTIINSHHSITSLLTQDKELFHIIRDACWYNDHYDDDNDNDEDKNIKWIISTILKR